MARLQPVLSLVLGLPMLLASLVLFLLMCLTFADVVLRSVLNAPIEAATELTRMAVAVVVFSALPVISFRDQQISVDLLDGVVSRLRLTRARDAAMALICGALLWYPAARIVVLAERARDYGDRTEYLSIPTFHMAWFIAVMTYAAMAALVLRGLILIFARDPRKVLQDV